MLRFNSNNSNLTDTRTKHRRLVGTVTPPNNPQNGITTTFNTNTSELTLKGSSTVVNYLNLY